MPSGKRSKQQRRAATAAPPPVQSKGSPRRRQASPKVLLAVGAAVVVAAVGIALGIVLSGGSSTPTDVPTYGSLANALPGAAQVHDLFKGIPQKGNVLGKASAPVTMVEYIDLQCPFCQEFETQVMPSILGTYVRPGKVRVEVRPIAFIGPDSVTGRLAMIAAGRQNHAFDFAELLYYNQGTENTGWLSTAMIEQAAGSIPGLNVPQLLSARDSSAVKSVAATYDAEQLADKVNSTPTIFVGKTGSTPKRVAMASATDKASLVAALDAALG